MPYSSEHTPNVPAGWPVEPPYERPAWMLAPHNAPVQSHGAQQPQQVVHHHYYGPQQAARRGLDAQTVLGWTAALGVVAGVLLAVAMAAVAIGLAALALAIMALVLRAIWRDIAKRG